MQTIDQELLTRLQKKLDLGKSQIYELIRQTAAEHGIPRHHAAVKLASRTGISIDKYASPDYYVTTTHMGSNGTGEQIASQFIAANVTRRAEKKVGVLRPTNLDSIFTRNAELRSILLSVS